MSSKFRRKQPTRQANLKLEGQKVFTITDAGGVLSNFGGLTLAAQIAEKSGLLSAFLSKVEDPRLGPVKHPFDKLVLQRLLLTAAGFPDAIDCSFWSDDPGLKALLGCSLDGPSLASQSTQTRIENRISEKSIQGLEWLPLEFFFSQKEFAPRGLTVYLDGSAIRTFGAQQKSLYRGGKKYSQTQYFPLVVTTHEGDLLFAQLRDGSASDADTLKTIKKILLKIKSKWKDVQLTVVMDTGFNNPKLLSFLDGTKILYAIGYPCTSSVKSKIKDLIKCAQSDFHKRHGPPRFPGKKGKKEWQKEHERIRSLPRKERMEEERKLLHRHVRWLYQSDHNGANWDRDRPLIHRVDFSDKGLDVRCVVTNIKEGLAEDVYDNYYCQRSRIEMFIKEQKSHCRVPLSCQEYRANQFRFSGIQAFSYILLNLVRNELPESLRPISLSRLRQQILLVPVLIVETARRIYWNLSSIHPCTNTVIHVARKLNARTA
jgi:hypothetical protein